MSSIKVTLLPSKKVFNYRRGATLMDILEDQGIFVSAPCGGRGVCGKCRIHAEGALSEKDKREYRLVPQEHYRLACMARAQGDVTLYVDRDPAPSIIQHCDIDPCLSVCIAVDLGTTALKVSMGTEKSDDFSHVASFLNPQRRFGHDVISRIAAASASHESQTALTHLLRSELGNVIARACDINDVDPERLAGIALSGNTFMIYSFLGKNTAPLGRHPYEIDESTFNGLFADEIELMPGRVPLRVLPVASAFLGGDLVGGLACSAFLGFGKGTFFFDLGTNGEMFYRDRHDRIHAASCAMGPALEGMNMSCGMTADAGAIDHVNADNGSVSFSTIGGSEPIGICGTGFIDLISVMLKEGALNRRGSLNRSFFTGDAVLPGLQFTEDRVMLTEDVYLSRKDVRNLQLAKGASRAAAELLLEKAGSEPEDVENVIIAGSFGEHLDLDNFQTLSFLPVFPNARWRFLGNTSLKAAELYCKDESFRIRTGELRDRIQVLELSTYHGFNERFLASLDFTNIVDK